MKAILVRTFGGPDVMKLEDVPAPAVADGQVRIRVRAIGVNPVDTYIRAGTYARKPSLPYIPDADVSGVIEAVGANVSRLRVGDRVYVYNAAGGYADEAVCDEWRVHRLPPQVSFAQGAAMGIPYGTAWRALLQRAQARAGEAVLVHGASGGVGTAAVQIARAAGLFVIGTAGSEAGLKHVREQGAHAVLDHRQDGYLDAVMKVTQGRGVNVVIEMLANVNLDRDLDVLAPRGRVVVVGNRGRVEIDPRKTMGRDAAILGMTLINASREEFDEMHAALVAGLENGSLKPVIGREVPLAEAARAHEEIMKPGALGKVVLVP